MGIVKYKKLEAPHIQGICVLCGVCKQTTRGYGKYRPLCSGCHEIRYKKGSKQHGDVRKSYCEECGFVAVHPCQLDVDHIDGNHDNNALENLQTLCANCHRLKSRTHDNYFKGN